MPAEQTLVFDTGPLSHFAEQGWLGVLKFVLGSRAAVIPDVVVAELRAGLPGRPHLQQVLDATWIQHHELTSDDELDAFGQFAGVLVAGSRNRGEAGVLAYAKTHGALAVLDDGPARKAAASFDVAFKGTLALLCDAVREGQLTLTMVSALVDDLLESEYRLSCPPGGFGQWAIDNGVLPAPLVTRRVRKVAVRRVTR
jgi:predicted nucleic acid-binding protein